MPMSWSAPISEDDDRRLRSLERSHDPVTIRRLEQLGVRADWRCLTLGAAGGTVTRWLRQQVGPTGRVMTADLDLHNLDRLPEGPFDMIHARSLLTGLEARDALLAALVHRLWPGGLLLVEECDSSGLLAVASGAYRSTWEGTCRLLGVDGDAARQLPSALQAAGLQAVGAEVICPMFAGGSPEAQFAWLTWRAEQERLLVGGLAPAVLEAALAEITDPSGWFPNLGVVAAWGRRRTVVVSY